MLIALPRLFHKKVGMKSEPIAPASHFQPAAMV